MVFSQEKKNKPVLNTNDEAPSCKGKQHKAVQQMKSQMCCKKNYYRGRRDFHLERIHHKSPNIQLCTAIWENLHHILLVSALLYADLWLGLL